MKIRGFAFLLIAGAFFWGCHKNTVSKIPQIGLTIFWPPDSMFANIDTVYIKFTLVDGDGDIGNDSASGIFIKDSRFDSAGFVRFDFPTIDGKIEDPTKGLTGTCTFYPVPQPIPRADSLHTATGDTLIYQLYITDRAGHKSNIITTHRLIIRP